MRKFNRDFVDGLKRSDVLGCDPAAHFGYHSIHGSGTWFFPNTESASAKYGEDYHQLKCFRDTLKKFIEDNNIRVVASEAIDGNCKSWVSLRKLAEFHGVMQELCATLDVPIVYFNQKELKKWASGNGNADKKVMMDCCVKRWHIIPVDDNNADAVHVFMHFVSRYGL